ncbi:hypothetical protein F8G81_10665 [Arthrobacter sp. CDRTa11]|uniref:hypothetical protein n=1 Tax=Arthrobacter sp. CDRTa11 TaxID=2651199 RepID=UPI002265E670|nr:hypothetical protein [Arthrobacter sp. CDRTa11]UZX03006.1 hypothetical protein F8G81_10665 [Arthrobacter sp. CDRTa11]
MITSRKPDDEDAFMVAGTDNELTSSRWMPNPSELVEVRRLGCEVRRGVIETVMEDNSGFWLAANGVDPRLFVLLHDQKQTIRRITVSG